MLHRVDLFQLLRGKLGGQRIDGIAQHGRAGRGVQLARELLRGRERLERHAVPGAAPLLHYGKDAHMTRASNFSFSTNFAAASFGLPSNNCVRLVRSGR